MFFICFFPFFYRKRNETIGILDRLECTCIIRITILGKIDAHNLNYFKNVIFMGQIRSMFYYHWIYAWVSIVCCLLDTIYFFLFRFQHRVCSGLWTYKIVFVLCIRGNLNLCTSFIYKSIGCAIPRYVLNAEAKSYQLLNAYMYNFKYTFRFVLDCSASVCWTWTNNHVPCTM